MQIVDLQRGVPPLVRERGLFSLAEVDRGQLDSLIRRSVEFATDPRQHEFPLRDSVVGLLFTKTSTRTRTAFSAAALRLGAQLVSYGPNDLQLATGESLEDTGRILGAMLDLLVARTAGPLDELRCLSRFGDLPVINAMAQQEHPSQAVSDLATMLAHFGVVDGLKVLYVGEGNNTAVALAHGLALYSGCELTLLTPASYGLPKDVLDVAAGRARDNKTVIRQVHSHEGLPSEIHVVYTTQWQTTGTTKADAAWREKFRPFHVDEKLLGRWPGAVFMHDLPARRGEEVSTDVLEGDRSLTWAQAAMKLSSAMAILERSAYSR
ncbi:ornithine carbamoyltransferase, catabolic [Longimycelium tulufanense]|uniref:Ornithine carbamoyltransferase, catabolic n=1 Tax=Longimycelium tulufanense TaxID=907463 RepID=A0A8J3C5K3_9PSEU|nr:ornithine carbamoyltransferase, catabolic [Longimycelium tulufanense]